jgi:hypothetical protein
MKVLLKKLIILILLLSAPILLLNLYVDPANIGHEQFEKSLANILLNYKNALYVVTADFDERLFEKEIITNEKKSHDMICFGSSRMLPADSSLFQDKSFFNHSMSGFSIEDLVALYEISKENHKLPKTIILGVDPWLFNKNNTQNKWLTIHDYYDKGVKALQLPNSLSSKMLYYKFMLKRYSQFADLSYYQSSLYLYISNNFRVSHTVKPAPGNNDKYLDIPVKCFDGSYRYDKSYAFKSNSEVLKLAIEYINKPVYSLESFSRIDNKETFERIIRDIKNNGIKIIFILPPYHPATYKLLVGLKEYKIIDEVEEYVKSFAEMENIQLFGSYNPIKLNLNDDDFYDGMHPKKEAFKVLFKNWTH